MTDPETPGDLADAPQIENIEILELLGKGGMSRVYKARQKQLDRIVAVKVLSRIAIDGKDGMKRFQREALLTGTLDHPNIVKTISFGVSADDQPYLVMEFLEGQSLAEDLQQSGALNLRKFRDVFLPLLSALDHAHKSSLVHRDIKPRNIMICRTQSSNENVKLVDFGIAKAFATDGENRNPQLSTSGGLIGSPAYMSPEQCRNEPLDGRSDLYSLSCVMYETLCAEPPFSGETPLELMQKHCSESLPSASDLSRRLEISRELVRVILQGLAKDPTTRPQTASEFARELNSILESLTLDKVPTVKNASKTLAGGWKNLLTAVTILLLLLACAIAYNTRKTVSKEDAAVFEKKKQDGLEMRLLRELRTKEKIFGANDTRICGSLDSLAQYYCDRRHFAKEVSIRKRTLEIKQNAYGRETVTVARALIDLASAYSRDSKNREVVSLLREALAIKSKELGPENWENATTLHCLAAEDIKLGNLSEAEEMDRRALKIVERRTDLDDDMVAAYAEELSRCLQAENKLAEAETILRRALSSREKSSGPDSQAVCFDLDILIKCLMQEAKYSEAESSLKRLLSIQEKIDGLPGVSALELLAKVYRETKREDQAADLEQRAKAIRSGR